MSAAHPRDRLETHDVTNQPPPFEDVNLFTSDVALQAAVAAAGGKTHADRLSAFGALAGAAETAEWAMQANANPPQLKAFDRYGRRIDEVDFHPAYHRLLGLGLEAGVSSAAWSGVSAGHVLHTALEFLMAQAEPSVCCPMTMTHAAPAAMRFQPALAARWVPKILASRYDPSSQPVADKTGVTIGMAMTEKQGGSDLRANTTRALDRADGGYALTGHKWFCSAPMSDAFLTLAYTDKGLSCFLVPRWTPDGERNAIQLMRLKDKLGDRANASAEIEYQDAYAEMVGEEGHGVRTILAMVHHTRFDCTLAPAAYMRQAVVNALWHTAHRTAFQKKLVDQPLMARVLADMVIESEAATALTFRIAHSFDASAEESEAAFARIATPVGKYWINKRVVNLVYEAMEAHGGSAYVEESVMPRLFRQSPLNSIWEGSGNVVCLDILRALERDPRSAEAFVAELDKSHGANTLLDRATDDVKTRLHARRDEAGARVLAETMALALQGAILVRDAPSFVSDAFCATRLCQHPRLSCGAMDAKIDAGALIARAMPNG